VGTIFLYYIIGIDYIVHGFAHLLDSPSANIFAVFKNEFETDIMDAFNKSRIGKTETVLVEGRRGVYLYGRSSAESPDIDGVVLFTGGEAEPGEFVQVRITGEEDGDAVGEMI
ncbi:MAG TPA: TRAM domain-containing protein, partial [Papillibacter sp.]|nr:TRAM domain-containing protein [Papillibacter sp.]